MKKISLLLVTVLFCFFVVGCNKEENTTTPDEPIDGGWGIVLADKEVGIEEDVLKVFNTATSNYKDMKLEAVALLGEQVVAGTNYMFLAKTDKAYKVVVVYKDLQGNASVSSVKDFDFTKYVSKNIDNPNEQLSGGWYTNAPGKLGMLSDEKVQSSFDKATETLTGMTFSPITVVGKQIVAGTNYAILCYGKPSTANPVEAVYLMTIYADLEGNCSMTSSAYIDLAEFNK